MERKNVTRTTSKRTPKRIGAGADRVVALPPMWFFAKTEIFRNQNKGLVNLKWRGG